MADETRIVKIEIEAEDNFKKLADIKAAIIDNKNQQAQLRQAYKEGNITLKEYSDEIVRNEANVKKQTSQYNELQKEVTGVKSPFDKLSESVKGLGERFEGAKGPLNELSGGAVDAAEGMLGMAKSALAFIATPIGAVIGAIGLALGALINYFKTTGDGADKLTFAMAYLKGIFQVFQNIINQVGRNLSILFTDPKKAVEEFGQFIKEHLINMFIGMIEFLPKLGEAIDDVFHGKFLEAGKVVVDAVGKMTLGIKNTSDKIGELGQEIKDAAIHTNELAKAADALEDKERLFSITASKTTLEIQRLTLAAKNRNLTSQEQIKLLEQASKLEKEKADQLVALKTQELEIITGEANEIINLDKKKGESAQAYAERFVAYSGQQGELSDELKDKIVKAIQDVNSARGESLNVLEKIKNKEDAAYLKSEQEKLKIQQESDKEQKALQDLRIKNSDAEWKAKTDAAKIANDEIEKKAQEEFDREKLLAKNKKDLNNLTYTAISDTLKTFAGSSKSVQVGMAIADAGLALTRIFSAPAVPFIEPFATATRIVQAVIVGAKAGQAISQIRNAAAGGGSFLTSGPTTLTVGDNPGGVERIDVTPISGKGRTTINPFSGMIALAGGGSVISDGGYGKNNGTFSTNQNIMIANMLRMMPSPVVSWKEFTELDTRIKIKQAITSV